MKRRKFLKRFAVSICFLTPILVVFASMRLRPILLIQAAQNGDVSLARRALQYGVSPNTQTCDIEFDDELNALAGTHVAGGSPYSVLTVATWRRHTTVVKMLLDAGADPNSGEPSRLPLMAAVVTHNTECVRLLLQHGANPKCCYDKDNTPILEMALPSSEIAVMLKQAGAKEQV
jgi:ankyrin repeat protein